MSKQPKTGHYWQLCVSYELPLNGRKEAEIEKIVGRPPSGSGAGFGMRDMDWSFELKVPAQEIARKLREKGYVAHVLERNDG